MIVSVYNPEWPAMFCRERDALASHVGDNLVEAEHIGSTSVPGLVAKPVIDMLVAVRSLDDLDTKAELFRLSGYDYLGEFGIAGRRYMRRHHPDGTRALHIHVFRAGDTNLHRHLAFRDYLRAHPGERDSYAAKKQELVDNGVDPDGYLDGKQAFVIAMEQRALVWAATQ